MVGKLPVCAVCIITFLGLGRRRDVVSSTVCEEEMDGQIWIT